MIADQLKLFETEVSVVGRTFDHKRHYAGRDSIDFAISRARFEQTGPHFVVERFVHLVGGESAQQEVLRDLGNLYGPGSPFFWKRHVKHRVEFGLHPAPEALAHRLLLTSRLSLRRHYLDHYRISPHTTFVSQKRGPAMKYIRGVLLAGAVVVISGCALTTQFIPVEGPLASVRPLPIIVARAERSGRHRITFALPSGEQCVGRWSTISGGSVSVVGGSLLSQYGSTYLSGYAVTSSGQYAGQALVPCANGNVFQIEFVGSEWSGGGFGIAKDSAGNVFRFIF